GRELKRSLGITTETRMRAIAALQQAVYEVRERNRLIGHSDWVSSVSFSPNGQLIASASKDKTIKLWSKNGQSIKTLQGHEAGVYKVKFSPDGQMFASASEDKT
ncbi:MAG TPA: hypothetical protein DEG47_24535, partial [Cyanobacteria bacterium UBA11148]|nr:hypothetical protein [Cyanobacteria bacterium UBA11148]